MLITTLFPPKHIADIFPPRRGHVGQITVYLGTEKKQTDLFRKNNGQLVYWSPFSNERVILGIKSLKSFKEIRRETKAPPQKTPEEKVEAALRCISSIYKRFGGRCHWCKRKCERTTSRIHLPLRATRDHLVRRADGGTNHSSNLVLACAQCNSSRHAPGWKPPAL